MKEFLKLEKEYLDKILKLSPISATYIGLHEYDNKLDYFNYDTLKALVDIDREYLNKLKNVKDRDFDDNITLELLEYQYNLKKFKFEVLKSWQSECDPARILGYSIFPIYSGQYAPFEERISAIISRLNEVPRLCDEYKKLLTKPIKLWINMAKTSIDSTIVFLDSIIESSNKFIKKDLISELKKSTDIAKNSLKDYKEFLDLKLEDAIDDFAIGSEKFKTLVDLRKLDLSVKEILDIGEYYIENTENRMLSLSKSLGFSSVDEMRKSLENFTFKNFKEVMDFYEEAINKSREFVIKSNFAAIPDEANRLELVETPNYLRHLIPFAAYFPPAKFEKEPSGKYLVTPPVNDEGLKRFNRFDIINVSIHEGFPGHHLQLSFANKNKSYIRLLAGNADEFIEGWALYCEDETFVQGFEAYPEREFVMLNDLLFRAVRIVIDVKLSSGEMNFSEAVDMLVKKVGMGKNEATAEVNRYTETPGYQLSYLIGKYKIFELRKKVETTSDYSLKKFHNILLENGSLPIFLHEKVVKNKLTQK